MLIGPLRDLMPGLMALALLQATQPALARGLVPVCTAAGTSWIDPAGGSDEPRHDTGSACPHGWCSPRKPRPGRG